MRARVAASVGSAVVVVVIVVVDVVSVVVVKLGLIVVFLRTF